MKRCLNPLLSLVLLVLLAGCAKRAGILAVNQDQLQYYGELKELLQKERAILAAGLELQLSSDRERQLKLLQWERDLTRAEVILSTPQNPAGAKRLLHMKMAELDLADRHRVRELDNIDVARMETILDQYDNLIRAVGAIEKNTNTINRYLATDDSTFALRSLDVDSLVYAITAIQQTREELGHIEKRTDEERTAESKRVREAIERAKDMIIKVFN